MHRSPESEAKLINKIANVMVDYGLDSFVEPFLETVEPFSDILGATVFIGVFPWFEVLGGQWHDFNNLLIQDPKGNVERLRQRITEIRDIRSQSKENQDEKDKNRSFKKKIKRLFRRS
jgi:hypothetical protein